MSWCRDDLRRNARYIEQALSALQDIDRRIAELDLAGGNTEPAEGLLKTLQQSLTVLLRTRAAIEREEETIDSTAALTNRSMPRS